MSRHFIDNVGYGVFEKDDARAGRFYVEQMDWDLIRENENIQERAGSSWRGFQSDASTNWLARDFICGGSVVGRKSPFKTGIDNILDGDQIEAIKKEKIKKEEIKKVKNDHLFNIKKHNHCEIDKIQPLILTTNGSLAVVIPYFSSSRIKYSGMIMSSPELTNDQYSINLWQILRRELCR